MKKVRYVLGAAGVAPALGMMIPGAAVTTASHASNAGKTVSLHHTGFIPDAGCTATARHIFSGAFTMSFYSAQHGSKTCIGKIAAYGNVNTTRIEVWVSVASGIKRCVKTASRSSVVEQCGRSFTRPFSVVAESHNAVTGIHVIRDRV